MVKKHLHMVPTGNPERDLSKYFSLMMTGLHSNEQYHLLTELDRYRNPNKYLDQGDDEDE